MADQGILMTTVSLGANLTEKTMGVPLGAARTIRDEVFRATFAAVDLLEGINQSGFKILREVLKRTDKLSQEAVEGLDSLAGAMARVVRGSGEAAGEMVAKTAATLAGTNELAPRAAVVVPSA